MDGGVCDLLALQGCKRDERVLSIDLLNVHSSPKGREFHAGVTGADTASQFENLVRVQVEGLPALGIDKMKVMLTSLYAVSL